MIKAYLICCFLQLTLMSNTSSLPYLWAALFWDSYIACKFNSNLKVSCCIILLFFKYIFLSWKLCLISWLMVKQRSVRNKNFAKCWPLWAASVGFVGKIATNLVWDLRTEIESGKSHKPYSFLSFLSLFILYRFHLIDMFALQKPYGRLNMLCRCGPPATLPTFQIFNMIYGILNN